jgi:phospholipid/cholesterol/gamma-HCH transport system substrate-binding protein
MGDQLKNALIGIFVIAACAIVVFMLLFLHPSIGDERKIFYIRFANIDKISVGTRVTFAGKPAGEVYHIKELESVRTERKGHGGYIYAYELEIRVDSGVNIFNTDQIAAKTSGLLGEKSVAIIPLPAQPGQIPTLIIEKDVLYADESGSLEEAIKSVRDVATKFEGALDAITETFSEIKERKIWEHIGKTAANLNDISSSIDPQQLRRTVDNVQDLSALALKSWANVDATILNAKDITSRGKEIINHVARGEGSFGKILYNDELYLRLKGLISKAEITFNDINHYGLLFNSDKGWQRLRARRLNLLQKLSSPQEFQNYFNDEVDQISTSISRVAMILDNSGIQPPCNLLLQDPEYVKVYSDLLRRITDLEESIQMYNQQVINTDCKSNLMQTYQNYSH